MYVHYLHGKWQKGEKLTEKEEEILASAFRMREYKLKQEREENTLFRKTLISLGLGCVVVIGAINYFAGKIGEYSVKLPIYLEQQSKKPEEVLARDLLNWSERSRLLDNQARFRNMQDVLSYSNSYHILEQERLNLLERRAKLKKRD